MATQSYSRKQHIGGQDAKTSIKQLLLQNGESWRENGIKEPKMKKKF